MKHSRRGGGRHRNEGRANGASLGIDRDAAWGHSDEGRRNIEPLGLNVDTDWEDGDQHLRRANMVLKAVKRRSTVSAHPKHAAFLQ